MEYVFFDIECACVYKDTAKICAFGYCLTDEKFNILKKEDVLINPKGRFHLTDRKGREGIVLPYEYGDFKNYPAFPKVYDKIRALLEGKDRLVFGHATSNDVKYLNLETKRFHLPPLSYCFFDTQLIYMTRLNSFDHQYGLEGITHDLKVEFTPHRAVDDAYATMRVAQAMCVAEGVTLPELLKKYEILPGKTAKGRTVLGTSKAMQLHTEEVRINREQRAKAHADFCRFVDRRRPKKSQMVKNGVWQGKVFCFSKEIENNLAVSKGYVDTIYSRGGTYCFKANNCNVYIRSQADEGRRLQNAVAAKAEVLEESIFRLQCAEVVR